MIKLRAMSVWKNVFRLKHLSFCDLNDEDKLFLSKSNSTVGPPKPFSLPVAGSTEQTTKLIKLCSKIEYNLNQMSQIRFKLTIVFEIIKI